MRKMVLAALAAMAMSNSANAVTYSFAGPGQGTAFQLNYAGGYITGYQVFTQFTTSSGISSAQFCFKGQACYYSSSGTGSSFTAPTDLIYTITDGPPVSVPGLPFPVPQASVGLEYDFAVGSFGSTGLKNSVDLSFSSHTGVLAVGVPLSPAPEPATWAMMVGGFGLIGTAMRRRNAKVSFA